MIYLVNAEETNLYKIGYTAGKSESRIQAMQTGCPYKLVLVKEINGTIEKEKWLHKAFSKNRKQGEWFEFDEETIESVCERMVVKRKVGNEIDTEEYRDMYERFIREGSCDFSLESFLYVSMLEIMLGNYDTAIQRLREYQSLVYGKTYMTCIPPLTEKIMNTEQEKENK